MGILFVSESQGWSGGAAQLLLLARGLAKAGKRVRIASPGDGEVAARAVKAGLEHIPFHPRQDYDLISAARLARMLEKDRVDVLHAHHPRAHAVGLASMYLSSRRPVFVVTRRVSFALSRNPFSRIKYRNPRIDGYVAVAENVREELVRGGVAAERVRTIPSGVDLSDYEPRPRDAALLRELAIPAEAPVVTKVANFAGWKGQDVFLDAAARVKGAYFLLAGRDTDAEALRAKARELGIEDRVRLLGFRTDIPRLLSVTSVSVNAAVKGEGISGALRESLSMEVPVAASDAGGNRELVTDGETGRLFAPGSGEALARVLTELLGDPAAARRQALAGRSRVRERYSVERMVEATLAYYGELAERRSAAGKALQGAV